MFEIFKSKIKFILKKIGLYRADWEYKIIGLEKELLSSKIARNGKKILFTHSFGIYEPCYIHDKLMAFALYLRGFEICATFCDGIQEVECNVYGGVWGGKKEFKNNCKYCQNRSKELWSFIKPECTYKYSKFLNEKDYAKVNSIMKNIKEDDWINYKEDGLQIGMWAKDILVNNYVVEDYRLIENYNVLGKAHLRNLLICKIACCKIINQVKPDRIISNDSYYGMWKIWEVLAKKFSVPFYSHWSGTRIGAWCYAYNDAAMNLDFSASWESYSSVPLSNVEKNSIEKWLQDRTNGKEMIMDTASLLPYRNENFDLSGLDSNKPTALLSANVAWDLAALNKQIFSKNMADWILETIKWFSIHPEYQLILKSHPAEYFPGIPETKETIMSMVYKKIPKMPSNVFFVSPKASVSVYDLMLMSKVGLVFTTSVGMEMAARGFPVITAGRSHYRGYGFTIDPNCYNDYFEILEKCLLGKYIFKKEQTIDLAQKFIKFNFFHYFIKHNLIEFKICNDTSFLKLRINIDSVLDLKRGRNSDFDYVVDSIELGQPILDKNKWMKESF